MDLEAFFRAFLFEVSADLHGWLRAVYVFARTNYNLPRQRPSEEPLHRLDARSLTVKKVLGSFGLFLWWEVFVVLPSDMDAGICLCGNKVIKAQEDPN